ncbi:MAG: antibiotic biosynthesis monooxygenase [Sphingobium sp.]|uniref:putative quinol monooxygenase n=1 Tax=Sphingobium sp. TaxID=1912891 RepID=UPI003BB1EAA8
MVAKDPDNDHDIWITEVWDSSASHAASLNLPAVKASIAKAIPLVDRDANSFAQKTVPVGGTGLCNLANT